MRGFIKALIGGVLGAAAIYITAQVAYSSGYDTAMEEKQNTTADTVDEPACDTKKDEEPDISTSQETEPKTENAHRKQPRKKPMDFIRNLFRRGNSKISILKLARNPESYHYEAYMDTGGLHVNVRPKVA